MIEFKVGDRVIIKNSETKQMNGMKGDIVHAENKCGKLTFMVAFDDGSKSYASKYYLRKLKRNEIQWKIGDRIIFKEKNSGAYNNKGTIMDFEGDFLKVIFDRPYPINPNFKGTRIHKYCLIRKLRYVHPKNMGDRVIVKNSNTDEEGWKGKVIEFVPGIFWNCVRIKFDNGKISVVPIQYTRKLVKKEKTPSEKDCFNQFIIDECCKLPKSRAEIEEKKEPKFKVGDMIRVIDRGLHLGTVGIVSKVDSSDFTYLLDFPCNVWFREYHLHRHAEIWRKSECDNLRERVKNLEQESSETYYLAKRAEKVSENLYKRSDELIESIESIKQRLTELEDRVTKNDNAIFDQNQSSGTLFGKLTVLERERIKCIEESIKSMKMTQHGMRQQIDRNNTKIGNLEKSVEYFDKKIKEEFKSSAFAWKNHDIKIEELEKKLDKIEDIKKTFECRIKYLDTKFNFILSNHEIDFKGNKNG